MFLCCSALHSVSFQTSTTLHPWREEEKYLTEDEISAELLADTLSDVPIDADSDSENDSDSSIIEKRENKMVQPLPSTTRVFGEYILKIQFTKIVSEFVINFERNTVQKLM